MSRDAESPALTPLRFVVPMPENVTNRRSGGGHWWSSYRDKKKYWGRLNYVASYLHASMICCTDTPLIYTDTSLVGLAIPRPPASPLVRVSMRSTMYLGGAMDDDNAMARHKPLIDWLKASGYLADDRKKNIVWEALPTQVVKRDGQYRIELTVSPLA